MTTDRERGYRLVNDLHRNNLINDDERKLLMDAVEEAYDDG